MKKRLTLYFLLIIFFAQAQEPLQDYIFFANSRMSGNYFYTKTSFQSPSFIKNENQKLPVDENIFFTPGNALQLEYVNGKNGKWSASIYRPEIRGQDHFKIPKYLSFHLYSTTGTTSEFLPSVQLMSADSVFSKKYFFHLNKINSWEQVMIPVDSLGLKINNAPDITTVVFSQHGDDGKKHTIYIDDIEFYQHQNIQM